tara:strand:+ start:48 stop:290 length:243 start_codon:yes stop_codon:yes gene_type:complete
VPTVQPATAAGYVSTAKPTSDSAQPRNEDNMNEDKSPAELYELADDAEAIARGLMQKAFDLRVQAQNKAFDKEEANANHV